MRLLLLVLPLAFTAAIAAALEVVPENPDSAPSTYSVEFHVYVSKKNPSMARIRWKFIGIDEIEYLRLDLRGTRLYDFSGTGTLEEDEHELLWRPASPYAHLEYKVDLSQRRSETSGYDSYAGEQWVITRAKTLFPRVRVSVDRRIEPNPVPRSLLVFHLPSGWKAVTALEQASSGAFRIDRTGRFLDRPSGWFALGRLKVHRRTVAGTRVIVAKAGEARLDSKGLTDLYAQTLPELMTLLGKKPRRLLVVSGPDPMWRGGISGRNSFFLHGDRPLRTSDRTSPPLHELFHILAPFRPAEDGSWVTEGLAEYYSLALQHRVGLLTDRDFQRGLRLFERYGEWHVNLTARGNLAAVNNSAPLVVYAIDRAIREYTDGERSLDDVARQLASEKGKVSTAHFLRIVNAVSGRNFTPFFQRHVYAGMPPKLEAPLARNHKDP